MYKTAIGIIKVIAGALLVLSTRAADAQSLGLSGVDLTDTTTLAKAMPRLARAIIPTYTGA